MAEDVSNFSTSSPHRLPTISASQALQKLSTPRERWVSTGLAQLDAILKGHSSLIGSQQSKSGEGGLVKGQVTEIYGPPGSGKTALAIQAATKALHAGEPVVWIDGSSKLAGPRFNQMLSKQRLPESDLPSSSPSTAQSIDDLLQHLHHYAIPTLPHLLALTCHPPSTFPPDRTSLIIIDGASGLFASAFPDRTESGEKSSKKNNDIQWASTRRFNIMGDFLSKLTKLAAVRNLAVVVVSQTSIKVKHGYGAVLRPAIASRTWADNVSNRIIVFRDFPFEPYGTDGSHRGTRFAAVAKLNGISYSHLDSIVPFRIEKTGLHEMQSHAATQALTLLPKPPQPILKRKREEVADSESDGDEFDWVEDDAIALDESQDEEASEIAADDRHNAEYANAMHGESGDEDSGEVSVESDVERYNEEQAKSFG